LSRGKTGAHSFASRLRRDQRGVSALEFALMLPLLVLFIVGTIDVSRLILLTQKLQSAAFTLADLTARIDPRETNSIGNVFRAVDQVVKPFAFRSEGRTIITSVQSAAAASAGGYAASSEIGRPAKAARLPAGLDIRRGQTIIAAEVYFDFKPLFGIGLLSPRVIRQVAYAKPRLVELPSLACPVT
jgi:Flp pilus assembly pilin Flp